MVKGMIAALPRLSLWLGNPNKAAVLFAALALVCLVITVRSRRNALALLFGSLTAAAGCGLILTFSRGGLLAFFAGALIIIVFNRQLLTRARLTMMIVLPLLAAAFLIIQDNSGRFRATSLVNDHSISNRGILWRAAPCMMADAPGGWGLGNSGDAFKSWYQPLDRHENYRTLVSSHFTWLAEFGRPGRLAYAAGWLLVLGICWLHARLRRDALPLALWTCLGIAATFSSVAEAWELWLLPGLALIPALVTFGRDEAGPWRKGVIAASLLGSTALVSGLESLGRHFRPADALPLSVNDRQLVIGSGHPVHWIVLDESVMGGGAYGRRLRTYARDLTDFSCGIARTLADVPGDVEQLALCRNCISATGELASLPRLKSLRMLSPDQPEKWLSAAEKFRISVYLGELAPNCPETDIPGMTIIPGSGIYLPDWPACAFAADQN